MSDYEIDQIRRVRHQTAAENDHDLRKLAEYYRRVEDELKASGRFKFADERKQKTHAESVDARTI